MKQILVTSGKGGTGKTVLTASFAVLAKQKVLCDCDVDAADLHILLHPAIKSTSTFIGGKKASVDRSLCTGCMACVKACRFDAIEARREHQGDESLTYVSIDRISCEGCGVCSHVCTVDAIAMEENTSGEWYISDTAYGTMVHARLGIAEENSGKLVSLIRQEAKMRAKEENAAYVLIDGPPGIGCPVIASLSGVDLALIVTEPTLSGIHDLERIHDVACYFKINTSCVINKWDINVENSRSIEEWCARNNVNVIGKIPFDLDMVRSMVEGVPVIEYSEGDASKEIVNIWDSVR